MKRLILILIILFTGIVTMWAQTAEAPLQPGTSLTYEPIREGDQFIRVSLGTGFPLFYNSPNGIVTKTNMFVGGTGIIGFGRYITTRINLGGEIAFAFNSTLGENIYFYVPVAFKAGYTFVYKRFQIPVSCMIGGAFQTYNVSNYFGLFAKPEAGVYFQYSPQWSFGFTTGWNIIPQLYQESSNNRLGHIADTTLGFRYHF